MHLTDGAVAVANSKANRESKWNRGGRSDVRSNEVRDASNRIFDTYADVRPTYDGPLHDRDAAVFAMGSCFAREIEHALTGRGGRVISLDDRFRIPAFEGPKGHSTAFFHRYTPTSMAQEIRRAFGDISQWNDDETLTYRSGDRYLDLNFPDIGAPATLDALRIRRTVSAELVRKAAEADIVILTLGLTEGWVESRTGLAINAMAGAALISNRQNYALHRISYEESLEALEFIMSVLEEKHHSGSFQLFITVSPVPLSATFTGEDIVIANMTSKTTLRAAAAAFVSRYDNAHYFPSYELVTCTRTELAWRPDRIHVNQQMVRHIMNRFIDTVYEPGAFEE